jgi:hypothetical protein
VLARGDADMVSMARPFLADSDFVNKAAANRADEINACIGCNQACLDHIFLGKISSCLVNPRACHETEIQYLPVQHKKKSKRDLKKGLEFAGTKVRLIGGAALAVELDANRAIDQGARLAATI